MRAYIYIPLVVAITTLPLNALYIDTRASHCDVICDEDITEKDSGICGSDGVFYARQCDFDNAACRAGLNGTQLRKINYGDMCVTLTTSCDDVSTASCVHYTNMNIDPICGSDNQTYDSVCLFMSAKCHYHHHGPLTVSHQGECDPLLINTSRKVDCSQYVIDYDSIALEDGSHPPLRVIPCSSSTSAGNSTGSTSDTSVCAFDGRTYKSECDYCGHLALYHQIKPGNLTTYIKHDGGCHTKG